MAKPLTPSRLAPRATPTSKLTCMRLENPKNKFMVQIWKLALKACSS